MHEIIISWNGIRRFFSQCRHLSRIDFVENRSRGGGAMCQLGIKLLRSCKTGAIIMERTSVCGLPYCVSKILLSFLCKFSMIFFPQFFLFLLVIRSCFHVFRCPDFEFATLANITIIFFCNSHKNGVCLGLVIVTRTTAQ